jgi:uncharacterized membrane-anchored protein
MRPPAASKGRETCMRAKNIAIGFRAFALCLLAGPLLRADDPTPTRPSADSLAAMASSLKWQTGTVSLKDGLAKINLTDNFRFLGNEDARKVLHDMWGNPDDPDLLGMIFPKDKGPLDDNSWAVTVNYEDNGYVKDDEAATINYDDLLKKMQEQTKEASPERVKEGYPSVDLVGWAAPPHYDKASHKLYWAKELKFGDARADTLNYDIRILGRHGVLVLGAISPMAAFPEIDNRVPEILSMVDFQPGNSYADFDPKIDKVAEYGLGALIAGGALAGAAKLGLFAFLFKYIVVVVLALKKAIIVVVVAMVAGVKKLMSKFSGKSSTPERLLPPRNDPPPPPAP